MPESAPHRCRYCGQLTRYCPCEKTGWSQHSGNWANVGRDEMNAWKRLTYHWLKAHPWCMDCGQPARVVCHYADTNYRINRLNLDWIEGQRCRKCDAVDTAAHGYNATLTVL